MTHGSQQLLAEAGAELIGYARPQGGDASRLSGVRRPDRRGAAVEQRTGGAG